MEARKNFFNMNRRGENVFTENFRSERFFKIFHFALEIGKAADYLAYVPTGARETKTGRESRKLPRLLGFPHPRPRPVKNFIEKIFHRPPARRKTFSR